MKCDLDTCIKRDNKNLYKRSSSTSKIIGKDIEFDEPKNSNLILDSKNNKPEVLLNILINKYGSVF